MAAAHATTEAPGPMSGLPLVITAAALAFGAFMQVLDATIANVAIPTLAGNMGVSTSQGAWAITSFAISGSISVPLSGWLMARYGVVRTFVWAIGLFTITSLLCGLAWDLPSLVFFRVLQGAFSGPMVPGSQALMVSIFPAAKRGTALGLWSLTTLLSPITGPQLGGYICDNYSWRWLFLINVPVGLLCGFFTWIYMRRRETATRRVPVDAVGFVLLVLWVGALQIMLDTGKEHDWFA